MENEQYLARMRKFREARSVLKIRFVALKGSVGEAAIFVFEGDDDKVVYGRWIARLRPGFIYEAFVCNGKKIVKQLQQMLMEDLGGLGEQVYLFIDRDFDDDRGFAANDNLFMTERYSIENYLVCEEVVGSILRDEFPCHEMVDLRQRVFHQFRQDLETFLGVTREFNRRLYVARQTQVALEGAGLPKRASDYASIDVGQVSAATRPVEECVVLTQSVAPEVDALLSIQFDNLEPRFRYRGKNVLLFFDRWLDRLADHFDARSGIFVNEQISGRVRRKEFTLGSYASRSPMPEELSDFVNRVAA